MMNGNGHNSRGGLMQFPFIAHMSQTQSTSLLLYPIRHSYAMITRCCSNPVLNQKSLYDIILENSTEVVSITGDDMVQLLNDEKFQPRDFGVGK